MMADYSELDRPPIRDVVREPLPDVLSAPGPLLADLIDLRELIERLLLDGLPVASFSARNAPYPPGGGAFPPIVRQALGLVPIAPLPPALAFRELDDGRVIVVDPPGFPDVIEVDAQGMTRGEADGVLRLDVTPAGTKLYVTAANGQAEYVLLDQNAVTFTRRFGRLYRRGPDRVD